MVVSTTLTANTSARNQSGTSTPALFMHPVEAVHGDLGMVVRGDVVLALSNSGSTEELVRLLPSLRRLGAQVVAITGDGASPLARGADVVLDVGAIPEACPLGLAPTASTTAMLALGDALALSVMKLRRFTKAQDITLWHAKGCKHCGNTGYTGRICILEMLPMTDPLRSLVMKHANAGELREEALRGGGTRSLSDVAAPSDQRERSIEKTPAAGPSSLSDLEVCSDPTGSGP